MNLQRFLNLFGLLFFILSLSSNVLAQNKCVFPDLSDPEYTDFCSKAKYLCGAQLDGFTFSLKSKNDTVGQPKPLCNGEGTPENMYWMAFTPCEATVELRITPSNCTNSISTLGIQSGIYSGCDFKEVLACDSKSIIEPITLTASNFVPGQTYYLYVDGYSGSVCDVQIQAIQGIDTNPVNFTSTGGFSVTGENAICTDGFKPYKYSISGSCEVTGTGNGCNNNADFINGIKDDWFCNQWTITPDQGWIIVGDHHGETIDIIWENPGNYTIEFKKILNPTLDEISGMCFTGDYCSTQSLEVNISELMPINLPTIYLCEGDSVEFCGQFYKEETVALCYDYDQCTYDVQIIKFKTDQVEDLGQFALCPQACYNLEGVDYCDEGTYQVKSNGDCDKVYTFSIVKLVLAPKVSGIQTIDCNNSEASVTGEVQSGVQNVIYEWYNDSGQKVFTGINFQTKIPGVYTLKVFVSGNEDTCFSTLEVTITEDMSKPDLQLNSDVLTCSIEEVEIMSSTKDNIQSYSWTGKNNFTSALANPMVKDSGTYNVTVVGANGCSTTASIEVKAQYTEANIDIDYKDLNCKVPSCILSYTVDVGIDSMHWVGPEAKKYFEKNPSVDKPGQYQLKLYSTEGCDYTKLFNILSDFEEPKVSTDKTKEWGCKTKTLDVILSGNLEDYPTYKVTWGTNDGLILSNTNKKDIRIGSIGSYFYSFVNEANGCTKEDTLKVLPADDIPTSIEVDKKDETCYGNQDGQIRIESIQGGVAPFNYTINQRPISDTISNLEPGIYRLVAEDVNGCVVSREIEILGAKSIDGQVNGPNEGDYLDNISLEASYSVDHSEIKSILWYTKSNDLVSSDVIHDFTLEQDTVFKLVIEDVRGCTVEALKRVLVNRDVDIYSPNLFSPNGDGKNDVFFLSSETLPTSTYQLDVFDRWGSRIYSNTNLKFNDSSAGWKGDIHGTPANQAVYSYIASYNLFNKRYIIKGNLTLVR